MLTSLSQESVKYNHKSKLATLLVERMAEALACVKDTAEVDDIMTAIKYVMMEMSSDIRQLTQIDLTVEITPSVLILQNYRVSAVLPKSASPNALISKPSDRVVEQFISGKYESVQIVKGELHVDEARVSGFFKEYQFTLEFGADLFLDRVLDPMELAAVAAHEIGHIWDFLDSIGEMTRTQAVAGYAYQQLKGRNTIERKLHVLKMLSPELALGVEDPDTVNDEMLLVFVNANLLHRRKVHQRAHSYDNVDVEVAADRFAVRHGLAYPLATAMRKLEMKRNLWSRSPEYRPEIFGMASVMMETFTLSMTVTLAPFRGVSYLISGLWSTVMIATCIDIVKYSIPGINYKSTFTPTDRINKMREDLIAVLREPSTTGEIRDAVMADIAVLNKEAGRLTPLWTSLSDSITQTIQGLQNPAIRKSMSERNLAALTNNRLYELAARLNQGV